MKHLPDEIIERYILGDLKPEDNLALIEKHFAGCYSCNQLKEEMADYYTLLDENEQNLLESKNAIVRVEPVFNGVEVTPKPSIKNLPSRIFIKVKTNPIKSTGLIAAALILAMFFNSKEFFNSGGNLDYFTVNEAERLINLYDKKNNLVWNLKFGLSANPIYTSKNLGLNSVSLEDLDGDGENELISTLEIEGMKDYLFAFDKNKKLILSKKLGEVISYNDDRYQDDYTAIGFLIEDSEKDGSKEIFVGVKNRRSPFKLSRFDKEGKLLGKYWHYGHIWGMHSLDVTGDGDKEIILCGINDDYTQAVLIILDPKKISGETESSVTRGFGLAKSSAEIGYILFPLSEVDEANRARTNTASPRVKRVINHDNNQRTFTIFISGDAHNTAPEFDITFDRELKIVSIKPIDNTYRLFNEYYSKGLTTQPLTPQTIETYNSQIKYWNGEKFASYNSNR